MKKGLVIVGQGKTEGGQRKARQGKAGQSRVESGEIEDSLLVAVSPHNSSVG